MVASSKDISTLEEQTNTLSRNSVTKHPVTQRHIPEERVSHPYGYGNLKTVIYCIYVIPDKIRWPAVVKMVISLLIS
jgi:hypothetical protein